MKRFLRWLKSINAFRIGLFTGLVFSYVHVRQIAGRDDIPLLTRMEDALTDLRFAQRVKLRGSEHSHQVVVAAVDEAAIAKFGRFPWDRRVIASLIDKLNDSGVKAIGFDMSFSDQDLGGQFAGAKRYRKRFDDISLASPKNLAAVERFGEAESDIAGAASALQTLAREVKPGSEPIYQTAKGRLDDGAQKLSATKQAFDDLVKAHEAYAQELDHDLNGQDPDTVMGEAVARAADKLVLGMIMLTAPEMEDFKKADADEQIARLKNAQIQSPEWRETPDAPVSKPVTLTWVKEYAGFRAPLRAISKGAKWVGYFNSLPDFDGVIRHTALALRVGDRYYPSLDAALAAIALGLQPKDIVPVTQTPDEGALIDYVDFGHKVQVPTDPRGLMSINYIGRDRTFDNYSIADIMNGKHDADLKDKIVLVGATAQGTFDQRVTPLNKISAGIETHANAVENILSKQFLKRGLAIDLGEVAFALLLAILFAALFARVKVQYSLPVLAVATAAVWTASTLAFWAGYEVFAALPLLELASMFVLVTVYRYATEEKDKRQLRKAFQLYLNPEVMEEMLEDPQALQLGGKELDMTVMFSDIRGFTTLSEKLSPQGLVHLLNEYLSPMTDIVFEKRGTLDKYIGDAVMAFYGAPVQTELHAANGCDAALQMMATLARLREKWHIEDPDIPDIDIGIGLNSGTMVVGNMGSQQRFNYTVMGDNVNLASRLEGQNKSYGTHILISEQTLHAARKGLKDDSAYCVREIDLITVKGKSEPVRLFELRSRGPARADELPLLGGFAEALALYREQKFAEARLMFESLLARFPHDGPSAKFIERCDEMMNAPPGENWNGVYKMEHK
ncbi:MAG TPA: adenylate/guanylate cyclase domain-containing protein [Myxococcales bacterium]|nr:adenylate/guanylate cyclase domain-containing protein [Myxococcales bacterium]